MSLPDQLKPKLRVAFLLPGLGRVQRGAEAAFLELARNLAVYADLDVTLFGSGPGEPGGPAIVPVGSVPRERFERWPRLPVLRSEYCYEEFTFTTRLLANRQFRPRAFDVAVHCSFPFTNWLLQFLRRVASGPRLVFVTQNGDWICRAESREYRSFRCDGLVCTNPEFFERNRDQYHSVLIPNGVDADRFCPRDQVANFRRDPRLSDTPVVLMVSALIPSKRVADGVRAVAKVPGAFLVLAGDGPDRVAIRELAAILLPGRHLLLGSVAAAEMPGWYRQADVFLHLSQEESFGIVYLEAAAAGLSIVAHDSAVPRWILGDTAEYADTADVPAIAAAIRRAANLGNQRGIAARQRVLDDWTWAEMAARYREFFYTLQTVRPPGPRDALGHCGQLQHSRFAARLLGLGSSA